MTFISTIKKKFENKKTPRDIYFEALEEAYGNLPVPSDDYAEIKELLISKEVFGTCEAEEHITEFEKATEIIREHYCIIATALNKEQKYG